MMICNANNQFIEEGLKIRLNRDVVFIFSTFLFFVNRISLQFHGTTSAGVVKLLTSFGRQ